MNDGSSMAAGTAARLRRPPGAKRSISWTLALVAALVGTSIAATSGDGLADEIVVKGDRLRGTVKSVTATAVEFETVYGKGAVQIPFEDVEQIRTEGTFLFEREDGSEARGKLVGIESGSLLVGESADGAERIEIEKIELALNDQAAEESPIVALKHKLRYWSGYFDLGLSVAQGTVDSTTFSLAMGAERRRSPNRFVFNSGFLYGTQRKDGETETKLADQLFGELREEFDLTERLFLYGDGYLEYNAIQRLSLRAIPNVGLGYKFWKSEEKDSKDFVAGTVGPSWVYEKYFGGDDHDYFAIAFGGEASLALPYGSTFSAAVQYLPAVDDFSNDFLIRSRAGLTVPAWKQLAFKLSVADDYDNTPAAGTTFNYLTTTLGISVQL